MSTTPGSLAPQTAKLVAALLLGALGGGAVVVCGPGLLARERPAASAQPGNLAPVAAGTPLQAAVVEPKLTDRERQVLARLASLPDLPVVQTPAFDVKLNEAPANGPKAASVAARPSVGESVFARIQVVSVEKGRVFYRSVDDQVHTARPGERLLGVNGRVLAVDEQGAELQIDGQRMRVAANNL